MSIVSSLEDRRFGLCPKFSMQEQDRQTRELGPCTWRSFDLQNQRMFFSCFDIEQIEGRFMLCGTLNENKLYIYDLHNTTGSRNYVYQIVSTTHCRVNDHGLMRTVCWYPYDTGIFITGCIRSIGVWDTNRMKLVDNITPSVKNSINKIHISNIATSHNLVAAACQGNDAILFDMKSGSLAHRLRGHKSDLTAVKWSERDEYLLATGSADGQIILWDVRSSKKKLVSLDYHRRKEDRQDFERAHRATVFSLCFSGDGLDLYSYGGDDKVRKWDAATGKKSKTDFHKLWGKSKMEPVGLEIAVSKNTNKDVVFVPRRKYIAVLNGESGEEICCLQGHYEGAIKCLFHPFLTELYSIGKNDTILTWLTDLECSQPSDICPKAKEEVYFLDSSDEEL